MSEIATVFIVEDNKELQELYRIELMISGFNVIGAASNGKDAIYMFKSFNEKPDIILMDHRMPIKNGLEAANEILQIDNHSKIIFMSADITIKSEALSIGAHEFLKKPFKHENLIDCIKKVLK